MVTKEEQSVWAGKWVNVAGTLIITERSRMVVEEHEE